MTRGQHRRLCDRIAKEVGDPSEPAKLLECLCRDLPDAVPLLRFWSIADEYHRASFYIRSEAVWFRRFGFRLMRPMFLLALVAAGGFLMQDVIDPAVGLACFLAGVFALYVTLQLFAWHWARVDERKLAAARDAYRVRLERLRDELTDADTSGFAS